MASADFPRVYYMGPGSDGGSIHQLAWILSEGGAGFYDHENLQAPPAYNFSSIAVMGAGGNLDPRIYYLNPNGHVIQLAWISSSRVFSAPNDLSGDTGTPAFVSRDAAGSSGLAVIGSGNNFDPHIFFVDALGRVQHLAWDNGQFVQENVLGHVTEGQVVIAVPGTRLAAISVGSNRDPRVYYFNADSQVQELAWVGHWATRIVSRGITADVNSGLAAISTHANLDPHVFYVRGTDRHLLDATFLDLQWLGSDVTLEAGGPPVAFGSAIAAIGAGANADPHVFYLSDDGHVRDAAWVGRWAGGDVTGQAFVGRGDPPTSLAAIGCLAATGTGSNADPHVYFLSEGGHVWELAFLGDSPAPSQWVGNVLVGDDPTTRAIVGGSVRGLGAMTVMG